MSDTNSIVIKGNLTRDVEVSYSGDGKAIAKFGLANNQGWGDKKETGFFDVVSFGKTGENASKFIGKGSPVIVTGRLRYESWEKDGAKRSAVRIIANQIEFLPDGRGKQEQPPLDDSEVPF